MISYPGTGYSFQQSTGNWLQIMGTDYLLEWKKPLGVEVSGQCLTFEALYAEIDSKEHRR